jgi:hypothetical protein
MIPLSGGPPLGGYDSPQGKTRYDFPLVEGRPLGGVVPLVEDPLVKDPP